LTAEATVSTSTLANCPSILRREDHARQETHLVADDQLLRQPLGDILIG
jgi:hypothetical protein